MTKILSTLFGFLFILISCLSFAEQEVPVSVKAKLVSDAAAVSPGESFKLGVLFEIIPGWHIYWKNSGDTGLPTKIEFKLPPGFSAGELKWPVPNIYRSAGDITDYGYEDSVLLYTEVKAPEDLVPGSELDIKAVVSWVSCEEICIPGRASLSLNLHVSETSSTANEKLFALWQSAIPLESTDHNSPFEVDIDMSRKGSGELVRITLLHNNPVEVKELIPAPGDDAEVSNMKIKTSEVDAGNDQRRTDIEFVKKVLPGSGPKDSDLDLLVVYQDQNEKRSGIEIIIKAPGKN